MGETKYLINNFLCYISIAINAKVQYLNLKADYDKKANIVRGIDNEMFYRMKYLESLGLSNVCDRHVIELFNQSNQHGEELVNLKRQMDFAHREYKSLNKSLNSFCYRLNKNVLRDIINYFDISIDLDANPRKEIIAFIIEFISEDFEKIYLNFPNFSYETYKGPITLIEIILSLKKKCEIDIKNYRDIEKQLVDSGLREQIYTNFYLNLEGEFRNLQTSMFNLPFKNKLIETLSKDEYDKYFQMSKITSEKYELLGQYEKVKESKKDSYARYKDTSALIDTSMDKLGEKSLKRLIQYLNINIITSEDNYFDENEEMRKALKKWFEEETKKISIEIEGKKEQSLESENGLEPQKKLVK